MNDAIIKQMLQDINNVNARQKKIMWKMIQDYDKLRESTNNIYMPLYYNKSRYLVLMGGGGSGKSIFAGQKILNRIVSEKGHRILVVRKVARTLRESCFQQLRGQIAEYYNPDDFDINKSDMKITYRKNGNEILFAGLDDVEKLKSVYAITSIWIEEASEISVQDYRQLDIRLRGQSAYYKQIIFSFNPISITHWLKLEFFDKVKPKATTLHTTYRDNRFLPLEDIETLQSFKDTDPYYYTVYCNGEWGVLGKTIFDKEKVSNRIVELRDRKPLKIGLFVYKYEHERIVNSSIEWQDDDNGYIKIYEDVKKGYPYVVGGDTSGEGSDNFGGQLLNNVTGNQVAVLKHEFDEDLYAKQMYCLGTYYNKALISIENNFSTYPTKELQRLGYVFQFRREVEDTYTHKIVERYGFMTTKVTRPLIIANLVQLVRENVNLFNDIDTLEEMLTFVKNENGRAEAESGSHDDLIISLAIAHYTRPQQSQRVKEIKRHKISNDSNDITGY